MKIVKMQENLWKSRFFMKFNEFEKIDVNLSF